MPKRRGGERYDNPFPGLCVLVLKELDIQTMTNFKFIFAAGIEYE